MTAFRVDTHLFRELGALLVGRDSTALAELIKNCYDAEATDVWISGSNLHDPQTSTIVVTDNGNGMDPAQFRSGFLTIAARSKSSGQRHSPRLRRRFTGAKGIGRLAAHKLAHVLQVDSIPIQDQRVHLGALGGHAPSVHAVLNWDSIEAHDHLDEIDDVDDAVLVVDGAVVELGHSAPHGTRVTLSSLRRPWTENDLSQFVLEVQGYEPPPAVYSAVRSDSDEVYYTPPLLPQGLQVRGARPLAQPAPHGPLATAAGPHQPLEPGLHPAPTPTVPPVDDPGMSIHLDGEFDRGESFAPKFELAAQYVLEIDCNPQRLRYGTARTDTFAESLEASLRTPLETIELPPLPGGPYFQARVFIRSGQAKNWPRNATGVRVYMEGFRVLPYGEPGDDWLSTDANYVQRGRELAGLGDKYANLFGDGVEGEGLMVLPATGYVGGVFLTEDKSGGLQMLVNREGFLPGPEFEALTSTVRRGIDYITRIRARDAAAKRRRGKPQRPAATRARAEALSAQTARLSAMVATVEKQADSGDIKAARTGISEVVDLARAVSAVTDDLLDELNMIRVLASVGTQMSAFVHELNGLLAVAQSVQVQLEEIRSGLDSRGRRATANASHLIGELRTGLERQASFLIDVTSADARRRRSAQRVADRVTAVSTVLAGTAERRHVHITNTVAPTIVTRPMFRAELTAILTNLSTNAVKAATPEGWAGPHDPLDVSTFISDDPWGEVEIGAREDDFGVTITVSNTGVVVDVAEGEKWFDPYASTTTQTDPVLGQGTGLGLTITRALVSENAGRVAFVAPPEGFATSIEVFLPARRAR